MRAPLRSRFWVEVSLAGITAVLAVVTLISREWIELVFGVDPDHGDGSLEWLLVVIAVAVTITFAVLARLEWRRAAGASAA